MSEQKHGKLAIRFALSLVIGGFFLYFSVVNLPIDWEALPSQLASVNPWALVGFAVGFFFVHIIRIRRWFYLVRPLGQTDFKPVFHAGAIGFAALMMLPFRLGELLRPYVLSKHGQVSMSTALGSAVVERVVDGLAITLLLFVALTTQPTLEAQTGVVWTAGIISGVIFGSTLIVLLLCGWKRELTLRVLRRIGEPISKGLTDRALGLLRGFLEGVRSLHGGPDLLLFLALTVLYWGVNGATLAFIAQAFGLSIGLWQGMALLSILVIGIMIPGPPGHVGTFQYFMRLGFSLFIVVETQETAVFACVATVHVIQFVIQIVSGLPSWFLYGFSLRRALDESEEVSEVDAAQS